MIRTALALASLLLTSSSPVFAQEAAQPREIPLAAIAGTARYALAASPDIVLRGLDPASQAALSYGLRMGLDTIPDAVWSRVMAGALQVRREFATSADTLWFNPLLDAGLVVRWVREGAGWRVLAAAPVTGETIRGQAPTEAIAWPQAGGALATALVNSADKSFATAEAQSWNRLFEEAPDAEDVVFLRAELAARSLLEMLGSPGYQDSLAFLRELLVTDDPRTSKLPVALRQSLTEMGDTARLSLRPITAFRLNDGWSVALQSPDAPSIVWFAHFADPKPGEPALPIAFNAAGINNKVKEPLP